MKNYVFNNETTKIELHFDKADYMSLSVEQKDKLKSAFLWSNKGGCWVSRAKEPNLWRAREIAKGLGFEKGDDVGKRLTFAEQVERQQERAENRAERYESYAENADKRAENLQAEFKECRKDWSWVTQPNINSSRGRAFTNQRNRVIAKYERGFDEHGKAEHFRNRAEIATETAKGEKYTDKGYLMRRIKECQADIRKIERIAKEHQNYLEQAERGEQIKNKYGWDVNMTVEQIKARLDHYAERIRTIKDKQNFLDGKLAELGGVTFSKENIKVGDVVLLDRGWTGEVVSVGTKNIKYKSGVGFWLVASFAEIKKVVSRGEKAN